MHCDPGCSSLQNFSSHVLYTQHSMAVNLPIFVSFSTTHIYFAFRTENSAITLDLSPVSVYYVVKHDVHLSINFISLCSISLN